MKIYLSSKNIYLREFIKDDKADLMDLNGDPSVMRYLTNGKISTEEDIEKMMKGVSAQLQKSLGKYGLWAAIEKETESFIGWFHLFPSSEEPDNLKKLFLGYRLKRSFWNKGYATEVSICLKNKAFNELGASEICAKAMRENHASINVMKKLGLTFHSSYIEESFPKGSQEAVLYSLKI